jgi:16S rRNA (guanine527-N7)-methyltransferase
MIENSPNSQIHSTPSLIGRAGGESIIAHYFPTLTPEQRERFAALDALYHDWNAKINVISRKDIDNLYEHHVLHSLGIAEIIRFRPGTRIMDLGTGGGFPGIPLAIMFPEAQFHLVDSIGKKIRVCNEVIAALGLTNVTTQHARAEEVKARFDFIVSRAVMPLADLVKIAQRHIAQPSHNALPNGLIALKGGELEHEAAAVRREKLITPLSDYFTEPYFETKKVVYVPL